MATPTVELPKRALNNCEISAWESGKNWRPGKRDAAMDDFCPIIGGCLMIAIFRIAEPRKRSNGIVERINFDVNILTDYE